MQTDERTPRAAAARPDARPAWREHASGVLLVLIAGGLVALFFLGLYAVKRYGMPVGWDTPRYLDQTTFVASRGLAGVPHVLPPPMKTLASRAGFPVVMLSVAATLRTSTFTVAAVVPVAAAAAFALAAGAFVSWSLRRNAWELAIVALVVGVSPVLIRLFAPETYVDNLFATAIVTAAMVPVLSTVRDGKGFVPAIVLIGSAGIAHGPFFLVVIAALALVAVAYTPESLKAWSRGTPLRSTPSGRLGLVAGGAAGVTAIGIFGFLRAAPDTPKLSIGELRKKLREDIQLYAFWLTIPLAAIGAGWLARLGFRGTKRPLDAPAADEDSRRRFAARFMIALLAAWTLVCAIGIVAYLAGHASPAHRFLAFLIPLPLLVAIGVLALGRAGRVRFSHAVGTAVVVVAVVVLGVIGYRDLYVNIAGPARGAEWIQTAKIQDAKTAAAVLEAARVPQSAPVVFVVDDNGPNPLSYVPEMAYMLRSVLPTERVQHAYFYVGNPSLYLRGKPTYRSHPATYNANMMRFWPDVKALLPEHPVALLLQSYDELYPQVAAAHPDWVAAPGVIALGGSPRPNSVVSKPPIPSGPRGRIAGALFGAGALVLLTLVGLGWAIAWLPDDSRSYEVLALSPAIGLGILIPTGVLVDAAGLRLGGAGGALTVGLAFGVGAALAALRLRRAGSLPFSPR